MDLSQIPKVFWHALSFSVVALTLGLLVFGYRSSTISIEIANTKIGLNQAVNETERLNTELQKKAQVLHLAKAELQLQADNLNKELTNSNTMPSRVFESAKESVEAVEIPQEDFTKNKSYIDKIKENLLDVRQYQVPKS